MPPPHENYKQNEDGSPPHPPSPQTQLSLSPHILFILMKIDWPAGGGLIELFLGKWWMLCHICHKRFTKKLRVNSILLQKILQRTDEVHTLFLLRAQNNLNYGIWKWRWQKNTNCFITKTKAELKKLKKKICVPIPGVEPGPPGWKPGILTARPYGRSHTHWLKFVIPITFEYVN